ncbi:hypothetical protein OG426_09625 [Streptomyces canus]|uniref:hypothetical protein n=1 Tax=Streptomyces canus TaxID=58343 RepID=UPI003870524B|nr:hypothetical protein OG426_09625 [Streptomyces canus]
MSSDDTSPISPHEWVDQLLNHRKLWWQTLPFLRRQGTKNIVSRETSDPEFTKNLVIFRWLLKQAEDLRQRTGEDPIPNPERLAQPADQPLGFKVLLARRFTLEHLLIAVGDRRYLAARLAGLYEEEKGTYSTWQSMYGSDRPALLPGPAVNLPDNSDNGDDSNEINLIRQRLARLMDAKEAQDVGFRHHAEFRVRAARRATKWMTLAAALFTAAVAWVMPGDSVMLASMAGGATGAALGGLIRLRDHVRLMSDVRQFSAFFIGQVIIGSVAGLVAFLLTRTSFLNISEDPAVIITAFVMGFSEAAFIGLLGKFTSAAGSPISPSSIAALQVSEIRR